MSWTMLRSGEIVGGRFEVERLVARARLLAGAAKIGDPDLARSYPEGVPVHALTLAMAGGGG